MSMAGISDRQASAANAIPPQIRKAATSPGIFQPRIAPWQFG
jgi:hypothetical protein